MTDVILHHYPESFFAEKIRRVLAWKRIPWRSVEQPMMMPKPELTALTGGYRRAPVLQIGADVYCDSACIARRLERLAPAPTLFPEADRGLAELLEDWGDHRFAFQCVPPAIVERFPSLPDGILDDRAQMSPTLSKAAIFAAAPYAWSQAKLSLDRLERALGERPFLLGDTFSLADAACYHPVWFLRGSERLFGEVHARPALRAWFERIAGLGAGDVKPMSRDEALEVARAATPADVAGGRSAAEERLALGDAVAITADDYGREETRGTIVRLAADEIAVRRQDAALGEMAVHFPRAGYVIAKL